MGGGFLDGGSLGGGFVDGGFVGGFVGEGCGFDFSAPAAILSLYS